MKVDLAWRPVRLFEVLTAAGLSLYSIFERLGKKFLHQYGRARQVCAELGECISIDIWRGGKSLAAHLFSSCESVVCVPASTLQSAEHE